jgi:hypothetical protein
MREPDLLRVSVSGRLARLAGRGPPEVLGKRWRSIHATRMPPEKPGESPNWDRHGVAWLISSWRSDGAFRDETQPRVKSRALMLPAWLLNAAADKIPARHKSNRAGATRTATWPRRGGSFPTCESGSDQTEQGITRRRDRPRDRGSPQPPLTSPERHDHEANCHPPQADRTGSR